VRIGWNITAPSGTKLVEKELSNEGYAEVVDLTITNGQTDKQVVFTVDVSQSKVFAVWSDQDITLETNSGSAPDNTIALKANIPYVFLTNWYQAFLLTVDVTSLYFTNASGSDATVNVRHLYDSTP
jgi:hypothetical protein